MLRKEVVDLKADERTRTINFQNLFSLCKKANLIKKGWSSVS